MSGRIGGGKGRCSITGVRKTHLPCSHSRDSGLSREWVEEAGDRGRGQAGKGLVVATEFGLHPVTQWDQDTLAAVCHGEKLGC